MGRNDYVTRVHDSIKAVDPTFWDTLVADEPDANPFMRHAYLAALESSASACEASGWKARCIVLEFAGNPVAACMLYEKAHSYGEYVFDWAWANAYQQHGLAYYPKATVAVPFTPVPGVRLLATDDQTRATLLQALIAYCQDHHLSSLHLLFVTPRDAQACANAGLMLRNTVQFHWNNRETPYRDFEDFLAGMTQEKRKKIKQERRKVNEAGVQFRWAQGSSITPADWDFFYRCYERTYLEHGNAPYLSRSFFSAMQTDMPENWLLFIGERAGQPIASSLIGLGSLSANSGHTKVAYGRYWGALERVDCLHFEACYYQPLNWCIEHGFARFEGGAQGEHKMARALMPVKTTSAHWLAHPAFADAVARFLEREGQGIHEYMDHLEQRSPFKSSM
jgi:hypothetical protein